MDPVNEGSLLSFQRQIPEECGSFSHAPHAWADFERRPPWGGLSVVTSRAVPGLFGCCGAHNTVHLQTSPQVLQPWKACVQVSRNRDGRIREQRDSSHFVSRGIVPFSSVQTFSLTLLLFTHTAASNTMPTYSAPTSVLSIVCPACPRLAIVLLLSKRAHQIFLWAYKTLLVCGDKGPWFRRWSPEQKFEFEGTSRINVPARCGPFRL